MMIAPIAELNYIIIKKMKEAINKLKAVLNRKVDWLKACDHTQDGNIPTDWDKEGVKISGNHSKLILKLIEDFEEK